MDTFRIKFTPEKLEAFKKELAKHTDDDSVFVWEGKQWLVEYAKHLAAYLSGVFMTGRTEYLSDD